MPSLYKNYRAYIVIAFLTILSTCLLWLPFLVRTPSLLGIETDDFTFETIQKNWDGPLYIIPAKTLYDVETDIIKGSPLGLSPNYFAAHLPLYPLTIKALAPFVGYPNAPILSTLLASIALFWLFFYVVKKHNLSSSPLLLTGIFMFIFPRWLVVRSVGSPEPLFILLIFGSLYFFAQRKYWVAGLLGGLSVLTKTPGALLFPAYVCAMLYDFRTHRKIHFNWLGIFLIPFAFLLLCILYFVQMGDFWAYFNSGDNLHVLLPPYQVFNHQARWIGTSWLEDVLFVYAFYGYMLIHLSSIIPFSVYEKIESAKGFLTAVLVRISHAIEQVYFAQVENRFVLAQFFFSLVFFIAIICVQHRDISRYSLPLLPIFILTFEKFLTSKKFLLLLVVLLPGIYLYAINFMLQNVAPIADWAPFL